MCSMADYWRNFLYKLFTVKTFVTLMLTATYMALLFSGREIDDKFINIYQLIIVFYFTYKNEQQQTKK